MFQDMHARKVWRCCFVSCLDDYWQCCFCFCATCTSWHVCFPLCVQECTHAPYLFNQSERGCFSGSEGALAEPEAWLLVATPDILSPQFACGFEIISLHSSVPTAARHNDRIPHPQSGTEHRRVRLTAGGPQPCRSARQAAGEKCSLTCWRFQVWLGRHMLVLLVGTDVILPFLSVTVCGFLFSQSVDVHSPQSLLSTRPWFCELAMLLDSVTQELMEQKPKTLQKLSTPADTEVHCLGQKEKTESSMWRRLCKREVINV